MAPCADPAIAPRKPRRPLDRVVAIPGIVGLGSLPPHPLVVAIGRIPATEILDHDAVAALRKIGSDLDIARCQLLVRSAAHERRVFTAACRVVHISPQRHAVTRDHLLIALNDDLQRVRVRIFLVGCGHAGRSEITPMLTPGGVTVSSM